MSASVHSFATSVVQVYSPDVTSGSFRQEKFQNGKSHCDIFRNGQWQLYCHRMPKINSHWQIYCHYSLSW